MKYLLILGEDEDRCCNSTIGCGIKIEKIIAKDHNEATQKAFDIIRLLEYGYEIIQEATLYQYETENMLNIDFWKESLISKEDKQEKIKKEKEERKILEYLKNKYE